jgi:ankyrin repeat protein
MSAIMDPVASIGRLSTSIAQLSVRVEKFAHQVRDAKQDMRDLSEKLASLEKCLDILEVDFEDPSVQSLDLKKKRLIRIVDGCDRVTKEMAKLLTSLSSGSGEIPWLGFPKTKMAELQDSLEEGQVALGGMIEMKQLLDAEERRISRAANPGQDSESMLSVHQSLLETADVPYAKEDPYPKSTRQQRQLLKSIHVPTATSISELGVLSSSPKDMRSSERYQSNPLIDPVEVRSRDQSNSGRWVQITKDNEQPRSNTNTSREPILVLHSPPRNQDPGTVRHWDSSLSEDLKSPQLIVVPIEHTGEYKEVISSNVSVKSLQNPRRTSEISALNPTLPSLHAGKLDQTAIQMAAKARNRLSLSEQKKTDKELLKRIKEGAEISKIVSLLDRGADPNASGPRNTVLTTEIQYSGRQQVIELLLSRDAEPNATSDGVPNHKIVEDGYVGRLKTGLGATRSIDAVANQVDILFLAALRTDIEIVKLLVNYGARVRPYPVSVFGNRSISSSTGSAQDRRNSAGSELSSHRSAVLVAAEKKKWDIVQFLVVHGADPNEIGEKSGSTLQLATASNKKDLMELLIEHGADVNAQGGQYGAALIAAAFEGHPTAATILLDAGANINIQSRRIGTALHAAVLNSYLNVVRLLLERGADTMIGFVLDTALQRLKDDPEDTNRKAIVRLLEAKGAKPGPVDKKVAEWAGLYTATY